ncbi:TetR-like C-terminal domain-containing protein [Streptomyces albireticuli]|uniref:TetR-like C-terminal domain-containing protein n=1 Tax=Streptomyces albireticuli TaxID=1940 RepID=UPI0036A288F9
MWAHAFRDRALADPEGFRLIYGDSVPGYVAPEGGAAPDAAQRVRTGLTALAAAAWPHAERFHAGSGFQWSDFDPGLLAKVRPAFPDLPPPVWHSPCASGATCTAWSPGRSTATCAPGP